MIFFGDDRGGELLELYRVYKSGQDDFALVNEGTADFYRSQCGSDLSAKALHLFERYSVLEEFLAEHLVMYASKVSQIRALNKTRHKYKESYSNFIELALVADAVGAMFDNYLPKQMAKDVQHPIWKDLVCLFDGFAANEITLEAFYSNLNALKLEDGSSLMSRTGFVRLFICNHRKIYAGLSASINNENNQIPASEKLAVLVTSICLSELLDNTFDSLCILGSAINQVFTKTASNSHKRYKNIMDRFERGLDA